MNRKSSRKALTLLEVLVVIAIIGILVAISLPAVQASRESARRTECLNKLRQIGLGTSMFHDTHQAFPPARLYPQKDAKAPYDRGRDQPSWFVRILPYVEQNSFYEKWDLSRPYSDQSEEIVSRPVGLFVCPSRRELQTARTPTESFTVGVTLPCGCGGSSTVKVVGGATGDYAGNHGDLSPGSTGAASDYYYGGNGTGVIISSRAQGGADGNLRWVDRITYGHIKDGSSNTILAGELHVNPDKINQIPFNGPIYNGEDLAAFARVGGPGVPLLSRKQKPVSAVLGFGSWHPQYCNFVMADGSTRSVSNDIDTVTLGQLCNRNDGGLQQ